MINILPPQFKEQINFSKRNLRMRRYVVLGLLVVVVMGMGLAGGVVYANRQINQLRQDLVDRQKQRAAYKDTEAKVQSLQQNIGLIEKLFTQQTKFSGLLNDLAAVLPAGSYINSISLTGDDKKPLKLMVSTDSFANAGIVRNALLQSPRIKTVDIQNITKSESANVYNVDLVIAFKEGQAR